MQRNNNYQTELYSKFKDIGLLDNLKAQMRYKLLEKLQAPISKANVEPKDLTILSKIINGLISDYLQTNSYNYSQAVFLPEIGNNSLKTEEILEILHIPKEISSFKCLLEGLIESFMSKKAKDRQTMNISTQTETLDNIIGLEKRLNNVDDEYKKKIETIESALPKTLEEKFLLYKKDLEKRMKLEMQAEVRFFYPDLYFNVKFFRLLESENSSAP